MKDAVAKGAVNLDDPAVTLSLLKLDSVVGVKGFFDSRRATCSSVGIECALCHSTVDDSFAPGIGKRLDGWANRDLNVGAIVGLSPNLQPVASMLRHRRGDGAEGARRPGGRASSTPSSSSTARRSRPDGKSAASLLPPAFGLLGVNQSHLDRLGFHHLLERVRRQSGDAREGTFFDPRLDNKKQFPVAAKNKLGPRQGQG